MVGEIKQLFARSVASIALIALMVITSFKNGNVSVEVVSKEMCYVDMPFDWADDLNTYTLANPWLRDLIFIFDNFCFDVFILVALYLFHAGMFDCCSFFLSLTINSWTKLFIQENFMTLR